jgi:signal transduction histidine kinase
VAALVVAALAVLLVSIRATTRSLARESHAKEVAVAAVGAEGVLGDLDATLRGYVLTRNGRLLRGWRRGRADLGAAQRSLERAAAHDAGERADVARLNAAIDAYLTDYALPLLGIARVEPATAASPLAQIEGKRRLDAVRAAVREILALEDTRIAASGRDGRSDLTRSVAIGVGALAVTVSAILLLGYYVASAVARPIRRAAAAAGAVAAGDFEQRLPEQGAGEVADLARAFNSMTRALDDARRELLRQNTRLEEAERQKSELISMVSHEVRTPLSSLLGFTDLLLRREFDAETRQRYVQILHQESRRLASLTQDFLDVRLLEEGRLELTRRPVDLAEVVREQADVFAHSPKHELAVDLPDAPLEVLGDRDRLSQVVGNLLANAIKYSPDGGRVEVGVAAVGERVRVEVRDHGVGIPSEDQPLIFTKFYRGHATGSGIPGTGLGLAIAHELVEAHGGTIGFESVFGSGTTFRVELPAPASSNSDDEGPPDGVVSEAVPASTRGVRRRRATP